MIKLIIFDLWETLIQTTVDWNTLKSLVKNKNFEWSEFISKFEEASQTIYFNSKNELKNSFFSKFPEKDKEWLEKVFYELFENRFDKILYFQEVPVVLDKLKDDYKLALLTNTESVYFDQIKNKLKLDNYFDALFPSYKLGAIKPDAKVFEIILNYFKICPEEVLMVGDSMRSDVGGARKVGIRTCWLNRTHDKNKFDFKADFEIKSMNELESVLRKLNFEGKGIEL